MTKIQRVGVLFALAALLATIGFVGAASAPVGASSPLTSRERGYRDVTIPAGTVLFITLDSSLASDRNRVEDAVLAHVRRPVVIQNATVIPVGSSLTGHVTSVRRPGRVKGRGYIAFRFQRLDVSGSGQRVAVQTSAVGRQSPSGKNDDIKMIGIPAAGGAVIGAIAGGKKGAAIGAAAGGGGGTAAALATRGPDARIGRGATATIRLASPVTVRVRT